MTIAKRVFNNLFWLSLSEVSSKGLTFVGIIYLARVLGTAGFGLFSLSLAVGVYFWTIVDMGVTGYGVREIAKNKEKTAELYSILNSLRFMVAISLVLIFCGILYILNMPTEKKLILIAGGFYVVGYSLSPDWVLRGLEKVQYMAFGSMTTSLFFLAGIYFLVKDSSGTLWASIIYSCSFLVGSLILSIVLYQKLKIPFSFKISFAGWLYHVRETFYFAMNMAFNNISIFIPIFFMGMWCTAENLGVFSASHRLMTVIMRAGGISISALYPVLASLHTTDREAFRSTHAGFQKIIIGMAIPFCIIATIYSDNIILFLFGASYSESVQIFKILIWLSFLYIMRNSFSNALVSAGFHRFNMIATGAGVVVITLCSIVFVPTYIGYGAAWSLIAGEVITLILMSRLFSTKVYRTVLFKSYLIKVLLASVVMGLIIRSLHFPAIQNIILGIFIYGGVSISIGIVSKKRIKQIYKSLITR